MSAGIASPRIGHISTIFDPSDAQFALPRSTGHLRPLRPFYTGPSSTPFAQDPAWPKLQPDLREMLATSADNAVKLRPESAHSEERAKLSDACPKAAVA